MVWSMRRKLVCVGTGWILIFCCWLIYQALTPGKEYSRLYYIFSYCLLPGNFVAFLLGHNKWDAELFFVRLLLGVTLSLAFYIVAAWIVLNITAHNKKRG